MNKLFPMPYLIEGKIQNYDWGTRNENAFIPKFLRTQFEQDLPYAEYWIGVHPKAPSDVIINGEKVGLHKLIEEYPEEVLGKRVSEKFNNSLPFLLKILSIEKALSIQAHPEKELAAQLHEQDPQHYPDSNHKPEIAIAIDKLNAIVGLKEKEDFWQSIERYPELKLLSDLLDSDTVTKDTISNSMIKKIYSEIMYSNSVKLEECLNSLRLRFKNDKDLTETEMEFLAQYENYGVDIGLISLLLFNHISIDSGKAIFTMAGVPHAYLSGNIVECMANSDNVVRAGLTPKFKDVDNLVRMLKISSYETDLKICEEEDRVIYKTTAEEFEVSRFKPGRSLRFMYHEELAIIIVIKGEIEIQWVENQSNKFISGQTILIPASLSEFKIITDEDSLVYAATVP